MSAKALPQLARSPYGVTVASAGGNNSGIFRNKRIANKMIRTALAAAVAN
jgi:hypothetical protein